MNTIPTICFFFLVFSCIIFARADDDSSPFVGIWTDDRYGYFMFLCVNKNRLQGAYSEAGLLQGVVSQDDSKNVGFLTASGYFYEGGGTVFDCVHGQFEFKLSLDGSSISGYFDCPKGRLFYQYQRISSDQPDTLQCIELDVNGLFQLPGSFTSSFNIFLNYDICTRTTGTSPYTGQDQQKLDRAVNSNIFGEGLEIEYSASYTYYYPLTNSSSLGFETGYVFDRQFPSTSPIITGSNTISSGFGLESAGWQGTSLMFRLKDGSLGCLWFGHNITDSIPSYNITADHGFDLYAQIYGIEKDCYKNNWVFEPSYLVNSSLLEDNSTFYSQFKSDTSSSYLSYSAAQSSTMQKSFVFPLFSLYFISVLCF